MSAAGKALLATIGDACKRRAKADANTAIGEVAAAAFDGVTATDAEKTLKEVVAQRWFDLAEPLGAALVARYPDARGLRKRHAQALIERGRLVDARQAFQALLDTPGISASESYEYLGFIGRTWKQQFVNRERQEKQTDGGLLREAIDAYDAGYRKDESANTWHGINAVACLKLAARRGIAHRLSAKADAMAKAILDAIDLTPLPTVWDEGTRAEAYVALGQWHDASAPLDAYMTKTTDPFGLGSTLRQFEEIWEIDDAQDPGTPLVTALRAKLIAMENGSLRLPPGHVRAALKGEGQYEKVFGKDAFTTISNYRTGLERCGPVARIGLETDRGEGTGFLMRGSDLDARLGGGVVLITNAHVIDPTPERKSDGLPPGDVLVSFQALDGVDASQAFNVATVLWSSPRDGGLDVTVARLDAAPALAKPYPLAGAVPTRGSRVVAVGHPGGGTLSFSLNDNELFDYAEKGWQLHYHTPTEGGSSGCPIFTKEWKLLGVHHYGGDAVPCLNGKPGTYQTNEGISINAIREALANAPNLDGSAGRP